MTPTDRAIRLACQAIVVLWIASFLGWRDLAPREVRVAVKATAIETHELPPTPPEPEPQAIAEPEPETVADAEPPKPEPEEAAQTEAPEPDDAPEPPEPTPEPPEIAEPTPERPEIAEPPVHEIAEAEPPPAPPTTAPPEPAPRDEVALPDPPAEPAPLAPDPAPLPRARAEAAAAPVARGPEAPPLQPVAVDESDVTLGGTLLAGDAGFPALESRYERYGSFHEYARAMERLGARFVVVDRRRIVGTIDPWTLETGALGDPAGLSPRARDFTGEPELARASRAVRREHGARAEVMMLVPRRLDAGLFGGIARALEARGDEATSYRQIRAHYERGPGGALRLRVEAAVRRDGREQPLPLLFDLERLARGSHA